MPSWGEVLAEPRRLQQAFRHAVTAARRPGAGGFMNSTSNSTLISNSNPFRAALMTAPWPGVGGFSNANSTSTSRSTAFRPALRACGRVTFFGCKKSNQKCASQAAAVHGARRSVLGVRCVASGFGPRSSCPCGTVSRLAGDDGIPASIFIGAGSPRLCW